MGAHLADRAGPGKIMALKRSLMSVVGLGDALDTPAEKRARSTPHALVADGDTGSGVDADADDASMAVGEHVCFKYLSVDLSKNKRIHVAAGAGGSIGRRVPIVLHQQQQHRRGSCHVRGDGTMGLSPDAPELVVSATTSGGLNATPDPIMLWDIGAALPDHVANHTFEWNTSSTKWGNF